MTTNDDDDDDDDDDDEDDDDDNEIQVINKNAAGKGDIGGVDEDKLADSFFVNTRDRIPSSLSISLTSTKTTRKKSAGRRGSTAKTAFDRRTAASRVVPMTSPKFTTQLMSMKQEAGGTAAPVPAKKTISEEGFTFSNMMGMMMMNQQQQQEAVHEERAFRQQQAR